MFLTTFHSLRNGKNMEFKDVIYNRRSVRSFLPKPVAEDTINEIISDALWSPSWGNTQPWEIMIVTGESLARYKKESKKAFYSGKIPNLDIPITQVWPEKFNNRYKDVGKRVFSALSIERKDQEKRNDYYGQMFTCFDAPALILIVVDSNLATEYALLDVGIFLQSFCLSAYNKGLGTCILAAVVHYADILRACFSIPESKKIVVGTALGWTNTDSPANYFERTRGKIEEFVQYLR